MAAAVLTDYERFSVSGWFLRHLDARVVTRDAEAAPDLTPCCDACHARPAPPGLVAGTRPAAWAAPASLGAHAWIPLVARTCARRWHVRGPAARVDQRVQIPALVRQRPRVERLLDRGTLPRSQGQGSLPLPRPIRSVRMSRTMVCTERPTWVPAAPRVAEGCAARALASDGWNGQISHRDSVSSTPMWAREAGEASSGYGRRTVVECSTTAMTVWRLPLVGRPPHTIRVLLLRRITLPTQGAHDTPGLCCPDRRKNALRRLVRVTSGIDYTQHRSCQEGKLASVPHACTSQTEGAMPTLA